MTLTLAGSKQLMAKRSTSIRGSSNWKTAKTSNLHSQPALSPPALPSRSISPVADLSSPRGAAGTQSQPRGGMSAAPIALHAPVSSTATNACHSIGTRDGINYPMNIVSDTPEPYLEPIKLLNKQSIEERQLNPTSAGSSPIGSVPSEKPVTLKQLTKSCFTGARFPSASSRPIPPPKVLLKRQQSTREEARKPHRLSGERKLAFNSSHPEEEEGAKKRELAYLIVDLQTGRTTISTKNKRTLGKSLKITKFRRLARTASASRIDPTLLLVIMLVDCPRKQQFVTQQLRECSLATCKAASHAHVCVCARVKQWHGKDECESSWI